MLASAVVDPDSDPSPDKDATTPASAPRDAMKSPCPANDAEAFKAPTMSEDNPPIPAMVATAERIKPRFAEEIAPDPVIDESMLIPNAPYTDILPEPCIPILEPVPPECGGKVQEYGEA